MMINSELIRVLSALMLIAVALAWGADFPLMKESLNGVPFLLLLFLRFSIAAASIAPFACQGVRGLGKRGMCRGILLGITLFCSLLLLITGLKLTTAANPGTLPGLSFVWVPLLVGPLLCKLSGVGIRFGAGMGVVALLFLTGDTSLSIHQGDLLMIFGTVFTATHILGLEAFTEKHDGAALAFVQFSTMALLAFAASTLFVPLSGSQHFNPLVLRTTVITAAFAAVFIFWVQTWFQRWSSSTRATIAYYLEPVFSVVLSFALFGEALSSDAWFGGAIILLGMIVIEFWPWLSGYNRKRAMVMAPLKTEWSCRKF